MNHTLSFFRFLLSFFKGTMCLKEESRESNLFGRNGCGRAGQTMRQPDVACVTGGWQGGKGVMDLGCSSSWASHSLPPACCKCERHCFLFAKRAISFIAHFAAHLLLLRTMFFALLGHGRNAPEFPPAHLTSKLLTLMQPQGAAGPCATPLDTCTSSPEVSNSILAFMSQQRALHSWRMSSGSAWSR